MANKNMRVSLKSQKQLPGRVLQKSCKEYLRFYRKPPGDCFLNQKHQRNTKYFLKILDLKA